MAETPLDLSKLPCPAGCRWEESIIRPFHGVTRSFSLIIGNHPIACVCIGENGDVSHRTGNLWSFVHGFWSVDAAVDSVLMTLGLTPAPLPEPVFTREQVRALMRGAYETGFQHGKATAESKPNGPFVDIGELRDACIVSIMDIHTAAIAAATKGGHS